MDVPGWIVLAWIGMGLFVGWALNWSLTDPPQPTGRPRTVGFITLVVLVLWVLIWVYGILGATPCPADVDIRTCTGR